MNKKSEILVAKSKTRYITFPIISSFCLFLSSFILFHLISSPFVSFYLILIYSYESVEKEVCKFFKSLVDDLKNSVEMLPSEENADEESLKTHTENPMKEIVKEADKAAGGRGEDEEENQNGANGRGRSVVKPSQQPVHAQVRLSSILLLPFVSCSYRRSYSLL